MRKFLALATASVVLALSGCAGGTANVAKQSSFHDDVDWDKMTMLTRDARERGYDVVWVNPPTKKKDAPANR